LGGRGREKERTYWATSNERQGKVACISFKLKSRCGAPRAVDQAATLQKSKDTIVLVDASRQKTDGKRKITRQKKLTGSKKV